MNAANEDAMPTFGFGKRNFLGKLRRVGEGCCAVNPDIGVYSFKGGQACNALDVGSIGLGNVSAAMAANLVKAGHRVTVCSRTRAKVKALAAEGARVAEGIADACQGEILITMLADAAAVEAVLFDEGGVGQSLGAGAIHLSKSTISIALSERLGRVHREAGQNLCDGPGFRPARSSNGSEALPSSGRPHGSDREMPALVRSDGTEDLHYPAKSLPTPISSRCPAI